MNITNTHIFVSIFAPSDVFSREINEKNIGNSSYINVKQFPSPERKHSHKIDSEYILKEKMFLGSICHGGGGNAVSSTRTFPDSSGLPVLSKDGR